MKSAITLPNNGVTRMPIKNQQWEANLLVESIAKLKEQIKHEEAYLVKRLAWIDECRRLGRS